MIQSKTIQEVNAGIPSKTLHADVVVIGGGLSGVCAAIAAARHGATSILAHNRPVLGGNASSEVGVGIAGASCANGRWDSRETGILEEIQLAARRFDPSCGPASLDMAAWEAVMKEPNCVLLLNTHITDVKSNDRKIESVTGDQQGTELRFNLHGQYFVDCTGDGTISVRAGCRAMLGREAKSDFDEPDALEVADNQTMGNTIYWEARDLGRPVDFMAPDWAKKYSEEDLSKRPHPGDSFKNGFWWVETGGDTDDTITDNESIRDELWQIAFGLWDHVKNVNDHGADNYVLHRLGSIPGKRENRRIVGDYILREQDLLAERVFEDAVAYGGWTMDLHYPGGMRHLEFKPNYHISHGIYTIPWRSLLAADCDNLLIGGRLISATHLASGSARVMATCAVIGQAIGTGVALALRQGCGLREVGQEYITELQQTLLRDDAFIPKIQVDDDADVSFHAQVSASSFQSVAAPEKIQDRWQRNRPELRPDWIMDKNTNPPDPDMIFEQGSAWISESMDQDTQPWIELVLDQPTVLGELRPIFDTHLSRDLSQWRSSVSDPWGMPICLVRDYELRTYSGGEEVNQWVIENNFLRNPIHKVATPHQAVDRVRLQINRTWGGRVARVFALRALKHAK